uniref:Reverse transcriptase domain-containing protein n=1 Tax=Lactuca sativa TaxID=4236 RepID=A0A9R1UI89_LACSA|nr:hypothetical protein LSAT_V11C900480760 [Lactuca sativa]
MASKHMLTHLKKLTNTHNSIRVSRSRVWDLEARNEANMEGLRTRRYNTGSPTKEFSLSKGVRQGGQLSPFPFIILMEGLNIVIQDNCEKSFLHNIHIPKSDSYLSHLLYANDALFIGDWSRSNLKNLARILRFFHVASALKLSFIN